MSVIVMGMDYPEHCFDCDDFYDGIYRHCKRTGKGFDDEEIDDDDINWHPDWCPLRPLPENHGRLIDADALPRYTGYALSADEVATAVENAPIIIEAEGQSKPLTISGTVYITEDGVYIDPDFDIGGDDA